MTIDAGARRVALLARPGLARDRLSTVLDEAGALCVLAADPTELDPAALVELDPQLVVVALDPLTEEVLEQFDAVLGDPSVDVIYEEAEQAASREGWDAARWQRHLVAKLQGHGNVLPPGREPTALPTTVADTLVAATAGMFDPVNAEVDGFDPGAGSGLDVESMARETPFPASELLPSIESAEPEIAVHEDALADFDFSFELAGDGPGVGDGGFAGFDPVNAEATPHIGIDLAVAAEGDDGNDQGKDKPAAPGLELSLQDDDLDVAAGPRSDAPRPDVTASHARISTLELVDDAPGEFPLQPRERGAVLILSGLGGPDAVRQLLGALPPGFTRPVVVRQHLDGGRYDRLVTQLQRATSLPVELAEPDQLAMPGTVYILPDAVGATSGGDGIRFCGNSEQTVLAALPSADSAVLLLSGSDPAHVEAAMAHGDGGALVAGQAADGCYDPAASNALAARGGDVAAPAALALRLSARWSNQGSSNVQA